MKKQAAGRISIIIFILKCNFFMSKGIMLRLVLLLGATLIGRTILAVSLGIKTL